MTALATPHQVRAIQTARRAAGLGDEGAYRAALAGFGVVSTKALTTDQAATFLDSLNGGSGGAGRSPKNRATGPFAKKLQALWIAGWNLGVVRARDDAALLAMVERQTGLSHTRFLRDPVDAARAIEAVKAMLVRDGGVVWPKRKGPGSVELKRAIVAAQIQRLCDLGHSYTNGLLVPLDTWTASHGTGSELDALSRQLGTRLRAALAAADAA